MTPQVGEIVYGFQDIQSRAGETMFLCSTQCNITKDFVTGVAEALEEICDAQEVEVAKGEFVSGVDPDKAKNLVVWKMLRIR